MAFKPVLTRWVDALLLSQSTSNRKPGFGAIRQEGVGFRNSPQKDFFALPVHADLGGNDVIMRPQRGVSIDIPTKSPF